jgi:hypothetical protein
MKKQFFTLSAIGLASAMLMGCASDEAAPSGDNPFSIEVFNSASTSKASVEGVSSAASGTVSFQDAVGTTFTISEARLNVVDIILDTAAGDAEAEQTYTVNGPYIMDLVAGTSLPGDMVFAPPVGNYQRLDVRVAESDVEDGLLAADDPMLVGGPANSSLYVAGTHNYNGGGNFTIFIKISEDIRFEPAAGIVVDTDTTAEVVLKLDVVDWLEDPSNVGSKLDLTTCMSGLVDQDNNVEITEDTTCGAENMGTTIKTNMKNGYDFS